PRVLRLVSGTGATPPLASFMFDTGQWATLTPWRARIRTSLSVTQTQWAAVTWSFRKPIFSSHSTGRRPVLFRWPSTSARVSERCVWGRTLWRSPISRAFAYVSSDATYTPWTPRHGVPRGSAFRLAVTASALLSGH